MRSNLTFLNNIFGRQKGKQSKMKSCHRLVQTLCLMNRVAITFASFWQYSEYARKFLHDKKSRAIFSEEERIALEQIYAVASYFFADLVVPDVAVDGNKGGKGPTHLDCARHMLKSMHAGAMIQAMFLTSEQKREGGKKKSKSETPTQLHVQSSVIDDLRNTVSGHSSVLSSHSDMFNEIYDILSEKLGVERRSVAAENGSPKDDEQETPASRGDLANFHKNRKSVLEDSLARVFLLMFMDYSVSNQNSVAAVYMTEDQVDVVKTSVGSNHFCRSRNKVFWKEGSTLSSGIVVEERKGGGDGDMRGEDPNDGSRQCEDEEGEEEEDDEDESMQPVGERSSQRDKVDKAGRKKSKSSTEVGSESPEGAGHVGGTDSSSSDTGDVQFVKVKSAAKKKKQVSSKASPETDESSGGEDDVVQDSRVEDNCDGEMAVEDEDCATAGVKRESDADHANERKRRMRSRRSAK